jgi:signal transduction histidine kinase
MISRLRESGAPADDIDLREGVESLLTELADHWGVTIERSLPATAVPVAEPLAHDAYYLLREAIANAVRHGSADRVDVDLRMRDTDVMLDIHDNGTGFAPGIPSSPRSITERVERNGGDLAVSTTGSGTSLSIRLPLSSPA